MKTLNRIAMTLGILVLAGCGSSSGPPPSDEPHFPDIDGLVVFYEFDGSLDNEVADAHHGTSESEINYVANRFGTPNSAAYVSNEGILVADHPDLDITGAITLAAWIKPEISNHAYNAVIDKDYTEAYSLGLNGAMEPDTVGIRAYITDTHFWHSEAIPYGTDTWTHIAFTFVDSTGQGDFYINGEWVGRGLSDVGLGVNDEDLRIGQSFLHDNYAGPIDQVAIFDRALSPEEIAELYAFE